MANIHQFKSWQEMVQEDAMAFAQSMEQSFLSRVTASSKRLPKQSQENRTTLITTYIDALITTCVGISGQYINKSGDFEENFIEAVRDKFTTLRKMDLEGKGI